jgi:STAS domain
MQPEGSRAGLTIRIEGVFDVPAARRVLELLDAAPETDTVSVDLSLVREFHDPGVAVLAEALAGLGASRVAVRGLRQHQIRMLRYLGIPSAVDAPNPGAPTGPIPSA